MKYCTVREKMLLIANHKLCQVDSMHSKLYILYAELFLLTRFMDPISELQCMKLCVLAQPVCEPLHFFALFTSARKSFAALFIALFPVVLASNTVI